MKSILFILVAFTAFSSLYAGIIMVSHPLGMGESFPIILLQDTPFNTFTLPGILLVLFVGGVNIAALFSYMNRSKKRYNWSMAAGSILAIWTVLKIIIVQLIHWTDFLYLAIALLIVLLAYQLKGKWAV